MNKRGNSPAEEGHDAYVKRQKLAHQAQPATRIDSHQQLKDILTFTQDIARAKHGIYSFKVFLESLEDSKPESSHNLRILKTYLDSQIPTGDDKSQPFLGNLIETWKYAAQTNSDALVSAVPSILAQLLRTLSRELDFADHCLRIGRTVLQKPQQELISRGISAQESKEYVISPALRLLREVVLLDGGSLAKQLFRGRDLTLKSLPRNLKLRFKGEGVEDVKRPSVRTNAMRLLLALLKYLPRESKQDLISQRDIVVAITREMRNDPSSLIVETLDGIKNSVIKDDSISRESKIKFINAINLSKLAGLYSLDSVAKDLQGGTSTVSDALHDLLTFICTSAESGIVFRQSGYYPKGVDPDILSTAEKRDDFIDLGIDSVEWADKYVGEIPVRNTTLSEFLQSLRPWSNKKHCELILSTFRAAPELTADYFLKKKTFSYDPKLTVTWIGYSAFIFSAIQLPIPRFFGHRNQYARLPPPTSVVIESILPQALNQNSLTKCLNQNSPLITLFAIRVLTVAFSKLQETKQLYQEAAIKTSSVWLQAEEKLVEEFCKRCPAVKDVIQVFRRIGDNGDIQREAVLRLLSKYYEVVPDIALDAKFSISDVLAKTLSQLENDSLQTEERGLRVVEAEHLFNIAHRSPDVKWFQKLDVLKTSPFMALLNLAATTSINVSSNNLESLLQLVIDENGLLQTATEIPALTALLTAVKAAGTAEVPEQTEFLEFCFHKCATNPLKYADAFEELLGENNGRDSVSKHVTSLLLLAITEEWLYLTRSKPEASLKSIAGFISHYLAASFKIGEDKKVLKAIIKKLSGALETSPGCRKIIERSRKESETIELIRRAPELLEKTRKALGHDTIGSTQAGFEVPSLPSLTLDPGALNRWNSKDIEEIVEDGHMTALALLLSSEHLSIRKEALTNLSKLALRLKESQYSEKEQLWLLISELTETARPVIDSQPLPTTICAFTASAVAVLKNPLHFMYAKVNRFLTQAPTWELDRFPLMKNIFSEAPSVDEAYYREFEWLLDYLSAGLLRPDDMAIFHKRRVFERLLSMYGNSYLGNNLRQKVMGLIVQSTKIEGGSTTLITRFGILSWLEAQATQSSDPSLLLIRQTILATCDQDRIRKWSGGTIKEIPAR